MQQIDHSHRQFGYIIHTQFNLRSLCWAFLCSWRIHLHANKEALTKNQEVLVHTKLLHTRADEIHNHTVRYRQCLLWKDRLNRFGESLASYIIALARIAILKQNYL